MISVFTYYFSLKIINYKLKNIKNFFIIALSIIIISVLYIEIKTYLGFLYSTIFLILLLSFVLSKFTKNTISYSIFLITLSLSINYAIFILAGSLTYFIIHIINLKNKSIAVIYVLIIYSICIYNFSKIKKFRRGFTFLQNDLTKDYISMSNLNISTIIIIAIVMLRDSAKADITKKVIFLFLIIIVMSITIKKSFELYYK